MGFSIRGVLPACLWSSVSHVSQKQRHKLTRRLLCCWLDGENNCCASLLKRALFVTGTPRPQSLVAFPLVSKLQPSRHQHFSNNFCPEKGRVPSKVASQSSCSGKALVCVCVCVLGEWNSWGTHLTGISWLHHQWLQRPFQSVCRVGSTKPSFRRTRGHPAWSRTSAEDTQIPSGLLTRTGAQIGQFPGAGVHRCHANCS